MRGSKLSPSHFARLLGEEAVAAFMASSVSPFGPAPLVLGGVGDSAGSPSPVVSRSGAPAIILLVAASESASLALSFGLLLLFHNAATEGGDRPPFVLSLQHRSYDCRKGEILLDDLLSP